MTVPQQRIRTAPARRRSRRLPTITWGGAASAALAIYVIFKTWPLQTTATLTILITVVTLAVVRPRRLARLFRGVDRVAAHMPKRSAIPRQASLGHLQTMNWSKFEQAVIVRAEQSDYVTRAVGTGKSGDRGCDGIVTLTNGARVLIQCKRYKDARKITGEMVRATDGAMRQASCNFAAIVTTSDFTKEGQIAAAQLSVIPFNGAATANWFNGGRAPWERETAY